MNDRIRKLGDEALKLDIDDRIELVDFILQSVQSPREDVRTSWSEEIETRVRHYQQGKFDLADADDVIADARSGLKR